MTQAGKSTKKTSKTKKKANNSTKKQISRSSEIEISRKTGEKTNSGSERRDVRTEGILLAAAGLCILLFLGNLHLAGSLGNTLRRVQFGLFGSLAYLFPLYLLWIVGFAAVNGERFPGRTFLKLIFSFLTWISVCGLLELLFGNGVSGTLTEYYAQGGETFGGGWFGGFFMLECTPILGVMGTSVILIILGMIGLVFATGRSFLGPLQTTGRRMLGNVQESTRRHREERELQREEEALRREEEEVQRRERLQTVKLRRTELKARSLTFGEETKLDAPEDAPDEEGEANPVPGEEESKGDESADSSVRTKKDRSPHAQRKGGKENGGEREVSEGKSGENPNTSEFTGTIDGAEHWEDYQPKKVKQTLGELEAMDRQGENPAESTGESLPPAAADIPAEESLPSAAADIPAEESLPSAAADFPAEENLHPAAADFSAEESLAAYDEFQDSPVAAPAVRGRADPTPALPEITKAAPPVRGSVNPTPAPAEVSESASAVREKPDSVPVIPETPVVRREYQYPPMELLKAGPRKAGMSEEELKATAVRLQQTLRNFGVGVTVTNISCGPAVTRYELAPDQGVKVSRIVSLQDDIKLNLAAADIRIEAPIPGKAAVGIEVPNKENQTVYLKELLDSSEFRRAASRVSFGVGRDIGGKVVIADLARMPHLLIAGATGSGKSVCINTIIMSILYKAHPDEVKLIMIDPKVVELSIYNGIPHLMIPVVTDPKKAAGALNWAVSEMTDRYRKFADAGVRDIKSYNTKAETTEEGRKMPQIVVIVDELADLMMVAAGEVEEAICRLAQLARAAGIHLVLATQRPSVNVITGLIKANIPSRIAFATSSGVDSRTILDMNGAEKLLGKGDMLFYPSGIPKPVRVQGGFVSDEEVSAVVEFLTQNNEAAPEENASLEREMEASAKDEGTVGAGDRDELFVRAGELVIDKEKASIGNLQRVFRIGFNRAARLMDQLAEAGVVGPDEGTKARQILMTKEQFEELKNRL